MEEKSNKSLKGFGVILIPFLTFILGWQVGAGTEKVNLKKACISYCQNGDVKVVDERNDSSFLDFLKKKEENPLDLSIYWKVYSKLKEDYLKEEDLDNKEKLVYYSTKGLVAGLDDPFSYFMTPEENDDFNIELDDELEGIGAALTVREGVLIVESILKDTPAEKVGLQPEDVILKIDGESTEGNKLSESVHKIRGKKGTTVALTVFRQEESDPFEVDIVRDKIIVDSVTSEEMEDGKIIYVSINKFSDDTYKEFKKIVDKVLLKNYKGMILDIRFNGGGYLKSAVDIASEFIEDGIVVISRSKTEGERKMYASGKGRLLNIPLIVLINKGTASASEILSGALQDYDRAKLLGEKSYGKGTVQEVETFFDNSSLRLTIAEWLTPKERIINKKGLDPDFKVERTIEDFKEDKDPQLDAAKEYILTGEINEEYLAKEEDKEE